MSYRSCLTTMMFASVMATPISAQLAHSKVYRSVDLEVIAGVVANSQTTAGGLKYEWPSPHVGRTQCGAVRYTGTDALTVYRVARPIMNLARE